MNRREAWPFLSAQVRALLDGGDLDASAKLILDATAAKDFGSGPPQDELNTARRMWLKAYDDVAPRVIEHERTA